MSIYHRNLTLPLRHSRWEGGGSCESALIRVAVLPSVLLLEMFEMLELMEKGLLEKELPGIQVLLEQHRERLSPILMVYSHREQAP